MSADFKDVKNLKIIPENYESATVFNVERIENDKVEIILPYISQSELDDYKKGENVEAFGLNKSGLIYFVTKILDKKDKILFIEYPNTIKEIQRRKYTRTPLNGNISFPDIPDIKVLPDDISAGGLKFISDTPFMVGNEYNIKVELINNLTVECTMQPIRVEETEDDAKLPYSVSAKFKKIKSIDRIALMQYSLKLAAEQKSKT